MFYLPSNIMSLIRGAGQLKPVGLFYRLGLLKKISVDFLNRSLILHV